MQKIGKHEVAGLRFKELHPDLRKRFENFIVSVAEIVSATNNEITNLFSRLQMGVSLNPAELRNAILSPMRHMIDMIATSHPFFSQGRIPDRRYKRQDYVALAFAMTAYQGQRDVKAPDLKKMYMEFGSSETGRVLKISSEVGDALDVLAEVNKATGFKITQKWIFVDLIWLIMKRHAAGVTIDIEKLTACYSSFEQERREFNSNPDRLIQGRNVSSLDRHLYEYILAFRTQGGQQTNLKIRHDAIRAFCRNIDRRD